MRQEVLAELQRMRRECHKKKVTDKAIKKAKLRVANSSKPVSLTDEINKFFPEVKPIIEKDPVIQEKINPVIVVKKPVVKENIQPADKIIERPPAVYSNTSPFGIAKDLHK
jgi:hypothetical protein